MIDLEFIATAFIIPNECPDSIILVIKFELELTCNFGHVHSSFNITLQISIEEIFD